MVASYPFGGGEVGRIALEPRWLAIGEILIESDVVDLEVEGEGVRVGCPPSIGRELEAQQDVHGLHRELSPEEAATGAKGAAVDPGEQPAVVIVGDRGLVEAGGGVVRDVAATHGRARGANLQVEGDGVKGGVGVVVEYAHRAESVVVIHTVAEWAASESRR